MRTRFVVFCLILLAPVLSMAQLLSDRLPDDAGIFIGWKGSDEIGPGYAGSNLKKIIDASNLPQLFNETLPKALDKLGQADRAAREVVGLVTAIAGPMWRHTSAFYFGPVDFTNPQQPMPNIALVCDAKDEAPALLEQVQKALAKAPHPPVPVKASLNGTIVIVEIGKTPLTGAIAGELKTLAANDRFKAALAKTQADPVFAVYINGEALLSCIEHGVNATARPREKANFAKAIDALGMRGFQYGIWTGGFSGGNWSTQAFVAAPAPRTGLLSLFDAQPLSKEILRAVPSTATVCVAGQLDLAGVLTQIQDGLAKFDPKLKQNFDQGLGQVNEQLQLDLIKDLFQPLGREWALYLDPTIGGNGLLGATIVNRLRDPAKAEESLTKLEGTANQLIAGLVGQSGMTIAFKQSKVGDMTIHYFAIPAVTPAWTIRDGNLYIALYPQVASAAAEHVTNKGKSILDNPDFQNVLTQLGQPNPSAVAFYDLPKTAGEGYPMLLLISRVYLGMADMFGIESPAMVLPPLNKILPTLSPAGSVAWSDAEGWHNKSISPFPGSILLAGGTSMTAISAGQVGMMTAILLPSLNRSRETANRVKCASNMRQIGSACFLYANEHKGKFPNDLGELIKTQDITAEVFTCPSDESLPAEVRVMKPDDAAAWVIANSHYIYAGAGKSALKLKANGILAYEREGSHNGDGMNILYGDGHVEFQNAAGAEKELKRAGIIKDDKIDPGL